MTDLRHDINVLVSIAKVDRTLSDYHSELEKIPGRIEKIDKTLENLDKSRERAIGRLDAMQKERRGLEQDLQDNETQITKYKQQLMDVKTNKEYQAMLKGIETLEADIDAKEERLLELMDELDTKANEHEVELKKIADQQAELRRERESLETRSEFLEAETAKLENEKPRYLRDIDANLQKKYARLREKLGGLPVANVLGENCGGCGTKLPPQHIHEVKRNDHLIMCEACGRILVFYSE